MIDDYYEYTPFLDLVLDAISIYKNRLPACRAYREPCIEHSMAWRSIRLRALVARSAAQPSTKFMIEALDSTNLGTDCIVSNISKDCTP